MRNGRIALVLAATVVLTACGRCGSKRPGTPPPPLRTSTAPPAEPVALVDGEPILAPALARMLREVSPGGAENGAADPAVRRHALESLVDRALLAREARARGIAASAEEVDAEVGRLRSEYGARWNELLAQQGTTEDELRASVRERLTAELLLAAVGRELRVSDDEVARYHAAHAQEFDVPLQVHAYQIVVRTREEALRIRGELRRGGPDAFEEAARRFSIAPEAKQGGDLGWFGKGTGMPAVFDACFRLPKDALSEVTSSPYGYHLFKVVARRPARHQPLSEVSSLIRDQLLREKRAQVEQELLAALRGRARIEIREAVPSTVRAEPRSP